MPYFSYAQIHLGPITLYTWGLFLATAFFVGFLLFLKQVKEQGIALEKILWLSVVILLGSLIGARLAYVLQFPNYYFFHPLRIFDFWAGGLMFYGGFLGGFLVAFFYIKKNKLNFWQLADISAPLIALGIFIVRLGCSLVNDHQGALTNLPWGIVWPDNSIRHPVAEYLALNGLTIFIVLSFLRRHFQKPGLQKPGQLFLIFLIWYSASRFLLDFTRATDTPLSDPHYLGLFISQWISLIILLIVIIMIERNKGRNIKI